MNVEELLTQHIGRIGGVHVKSLVGGHPPFENADFLFRADGVIAELKCLDEDVINDSFFIEKATAVHMAALQRDSSRTTPVVFGDQLVSSAGRSDEFIKAIRDLYYEQLKRAIKKANKQIKETATRMGIEGAKGLLLIANNNHTALEPWHAIELFKEAFKRETFSGINSILYLSAGQGIEVVGEGLQLDVIVEYRSPLKDALDRAFIHRFNRVWMEALAGERGAKVPGSVYEAGSNFLPSIRNKPRSL